MSEKDESIAATDEELAETLRALTEKMKPLEREYAELLNKHFWDLLA